MLALAWGLAALAAGLTPRARWPSSAATLAPALLVALLPFQLVAGGWWPSMARSAEVALVAAGLGWAALSLAPHAAARALGTLVAFALAGFHLAFGVVALDNGGPVPGFVALKSVAAGVAILATLALGTRARRPAALLLLLGLAAATALAVTQWAPAIPAEGYLRW